MNSLFNITPCNSHEISGSGDAPPSPYAGVVPANFENSNGVRDERLYLLFI